MKIVMKANEAPERLYLSKNIYSTFLYQVPDPDDETAVEYTRTDAFIKKAREWLRTNLSNYFDDTRETFELFIDDFVKFIKE